MNFERKNKVNTEKSEKVPLGKESVMIRTKKEE